MAEQSDPHFEPADLLVTTPTPSIEIPAQEDLLQKHKRTSGKASTTRSSDILNQELNSIKRTQWQKD